MKTVLLSIISLFCVTNGQLINNGSISQPKLINGKKVLCYYDANSLLRTTKYRFYPRDINTKFCTHIVSIYATLDPFNYTIKSSNVPAINNPTSGADYLTLSRLKDADSGLRIIIAIGGWQDSRDDTTNRAKYSLLAADGAKREIFINSVITLLETFNFDGISFEWQDPTFVSDNRADRQNYVTLLREIKQRFGARYELFVAVSSADFHQTGYEMSEIVQIADLVSIMAFNYVGWWSNPKLVGHHSALRQRPDASQKAPAQASGSVSVESNFKYLINDLNLNSSKLILAIPFFGRSFYLSDMNRHAPFDAFDSEGTGHGPVANLNEGMFTFSEICKELTDVTSAHIPVVTHDNYWVAPYSVKGRLWNGYDDERSVRAKVNFMKKKQLAGILIYNIDFDDFLGECYGRKFPLLDAAYRQIMRR